MSPAGRRARRRRLTRPRPLTETRLVGHGGAVSLEEFSRDPHEVVANLRWIEHLDRRTPAGEVLGDALDRRSADDRVGEIVGLVTIAGELDERQILTELSAQRPHMATIEADRTPHLGAQFAHVGDDGLPRIREIEVRRAAAQRDR